jgi:hypothetical protein
LLAIFCFFNLFNKAFGQSVKSNPDYTYSIGANIYSGSVIKHDRFMGHLSQGITKGAEILINKNTYGKQVWEQVFKYPDIGFAMSYFNYGDEILGESLAGTFYIDFILKRARKFEVLFKIGTGIGYHTKPYNRETNNQNVAVGGPVSNDMQIRLGLNYKLTDRWKLTGAFTLSHFSVAALTQPNKGINIATANLGCTYQLTNSIPEYTPIEENYTWDKRIKYNINFNYGLKKIPPIGGPFYPVYVLSFYVNKQVSKISIINAGIDGFSNYALKEEMMQSDIHPDSLDHRRIGIMAGHELKMHRISLLTQLGVYIYRPYKTDKIVYQRIGLKFYFGNNVYLHYGFITHFAKADHSEWGIGLTI